MTGLLDWAQGDRLGLDIESTGVNPHEDRIVTCALVHVPRTGRPKSVTWLIDPQVPIPDEAAEIHGWTTERIQAHPDARDPGEALFEIVGRIAFTMHRNPGMPLVLMNAPYDLTMLEAESARHGVDPLTVRMPRGLRPVVDVGVLDKYVDRYRKGGRKLVDLCATYGVVLAGAHSADGDALAACRLFPRIVEKHPGKFRNLTIDGLHQGQVGWRKSQMDGLRRYFDKQGTPHDGCDPAWPLLSAPVAPALGGGARG